MIGQLIKKRGVIKSCQSNYRPKYLKFSKNVTIEIVLNLFDYHIFKGEMTFFTGC